MHIGNYLNLLQQSDRQLAIGFEEIAQKHGDEPDVYGTCRLLASWSRQHVEELNPLIARYSDQKSAEPERLHQALFQGTRTGSLALMRDLHDLWLQASEVQLCWTVLMQAAQALRDPALQATYEQQSKQTERQLGWISTRIKQSAPQTLVVAD